MATGLMQLLLRDPKKAAAALERDIKAGGSPDAVMSLLDDVEQLAQLRGLSVGPLISAIRSQLRRRSTPPGIRHQP